MQFPLKSVSTLEHHMLTCLLPGRYQPAQHKLQTEAQLVQEESCDTTYTCIMYHMNAAANKSGVLQTDVIAMESVCLHVLSVVWRLLTSPIMPDNIFVHRSPYYVLLKAT
jgi:hypothetical protein